MSGDIGKGTASKSSNFASYILDEILLQDKNLQLAISVSSDNNSILTPPQYSQMDINMNNLGSKQFIQLAGGTNNYSYQKAIEDGLVGSQSFGGLAFGGYVRREIGEYYKNWNFYIRKP